MAKKIVTRARKRPPAEVDLAELLGDEWAELRIGPGGLSVPGWRRPFEAGELRSMFARLQLLTTLEDENRRLRRERAAAWEAAEAAEDRAAWYRSQLRLESSCGLMLARLRA